MDPYRRDRPSSSTGFRNPTTPQDKLFETFVAALEESGASVTPHSSPAVSPQRVIVERNGECTEVLAHLRPIYPTAPRPGDPAPQWGPKRFRLGFRTAERSMTGQTVIVGHDAETNIFVGLDPAAYLKTGRRGLWYAYPDQEMTWDAIEHGFSASSKDGCVMFAMTAPHLASYVVDAAAVHDDAMDNFVLGLYRKAPTLTAMPWDDIKKVSMDRRIHVKRKVQGILTDKFRDAVRRAYDRKCAITGVDAGCISDAAHIYPKSEKDSSYHPSNGILLRPDLHRAFHRTLLYLDFIKGKSGDMECRMMFNELLRDKLKGKGSAAGIEEFEKYNLRKLRDTTHPGDRPSKTWVDKAIEFHDVFMRRGKKKKRRRGKQTASICD